MSDDGVEERLPALAVAAVNQVSVDGREQADFALSPLWELVGDCVSATSATQCAPEPDSFRHVAQRHSHNAACIAVAVPDLGTRSAEACG